METGAPRGGSGIHWEWPPFSRGPFSLGAAIKTRGCPPLTLCQTFCYFPFFNLYLSFSLSLSLSLSLSNSLSLLLSLLCVLTVEQKNEGKRTKPFDRPSEAKRSSRRKWFYNWHPEIIFLSSNPPPPHSKKGEEDKFILRRNPTLFLSHVSIKYSFLLQGRTCHENRPNRSKNTGKILYLCL